jgi:signal recognition particle receptor subunit beta
LALVDASRKTVILKVVYCGCALGGKTTNLVTLHRLTDPGGERGLVSIATRDDRTLFFDLLPIELGQIGGMRITVKVYTVPGQTFYEATRRQVLAGADGVVIVCDSSPDQRQANAWAVENVRTILTAHGFDPASFPTVLQWNKRDLPNALPIEAMQREFNAKELWAGPAVAVSGAGVVDTFGAILRATIWKTCASMGRNVVSQSAIDRTVEAALEGAMKRQPPLPDPKRSGVAANPGSAPKTISEAPAFEHRVDTTVYRGGSRDSDITRKVLDQESLLGEAVQTSMELAERLDSMGDVEATSDRRGRMLEALETLTAAMTDVGGAAMPAGMTAALLAGSGRRQGSLLLVNASGKGVEEREVVPPGRDVLNGPQVASLGTAAWRLVERKTFLVVDDLVGEVFFGAAPPGAENVGSAVVAPVLADGHLFGAVVVYAHHDERPFDDAEQRYWKAAASLLGLGLHWRALRRRVAEALRPAAPAREVAR